MPINDDFSQNTLETRYQLLGFQGTAPVGSAFQENAELHLVAGPTTTEVKSLAAIQRYFYSGVGTESFHLQIDAGIGSGSSLLGTAGLAVVNPLNPQEAVTLVGLAKLMIPGYERSWVFTDIPGIAGAVTQAFDVSLDTLHTLVLDYDASTSIMIVSVPDAGFFKVAVLPAYQAGFQIVLVSQTGAFLNSIAKSEALFDNLQSDLTADPYLVSFTPFSLDGVTYDAAFSSDPAGGNAVYYTLNVPTFALARVAVNDTWLQLGGETSISAALVTFGIHHSTIYTELDCASFQAALPAGAVLDRFINNALVAAGASYDYVWNPFPAVFSADCGYGSQVSIWGFTPNYAAGGSRVTVAGYNFGTSPGSLWVGGMPVEPDMWSNDRITFNVPIELAAGIQTVTVDTDTQSTSADFVVTPAITTVFPTELTSGTTLYLSGTGFGNDSSRGSVWVDNQYSRILTWSPYQIGLALPREASPGSVTMITRVNGIQSNAALVTISPYIYSLSISLIKNSPTLIVRGSNFGAPNQDGIFGLILDGQPLTTLSWSSETIRAVLPGTLTNGDHTIEVVAANLASNTVKFSIRHNQLTIGYLSAVTSPGNSIRDQEVIPGGVIPGGLLVDFEPNTIRFLDDTTFEPIDRVVISNPQLAGMLKGIGTYRFERRQTTEGHPDSYFIYFTRPMNTATARGILSLAKEVLIVLPLVAVDSRWTGAFDYPDPSQTNDFNLGKLTAVQVPRANLVERGSPFEWIAVVDKNFPNIMSDLTAHLMNRSVLLPADTGNSYVAHGEFVASICCAATNSFGLAGVAPSSFWGMYPDDYSKNHDLTESENHVQDFNHSMQLTELAVRDGAAVVNMSWGLIRPSASHSTENELTSADFDLLKSYWKPEISALLDNYPHVSLVVAVPNYTNCLDATDSKTATDGIPDTLDPRIISVGGEMACNTSWVTVAAPTGWAAFYSTGGVDFDTTLAQTSPIFKPWWAYGIDNQLRQRASDEKTTMGIGTSFATPVVAGVAALLHAWNPNLTGAEVTSVLKSTASTSTIPSGWYTSLKYGSGYVQAYSALMAAEKLRTGKLQVPSLEDLGSEGENTVTFTVEEGSTATGYIQIQNPGDGVTYFEGVAGRLYLECHNFICLPNVDTHFSFAPADIASNGFYSVGNGNTEITEGYIKPETTEYVAVKISSDGYEVGDSYLSLFKLSVHSSHGDYAQTTYDTLTWLIKVNVVAQSPCFTSRALVHTPLEKEIRTLHDFRDKVMVPDRSHGADWVGYYYQHAPRIVQAYLNDPSEIVRYRELISRYAPVIKAKITEAAGLYALADKGILEQKVSAEDIHAAKEFLSKAAEANGAFQQDAASLIQIASSTEGMTYRDALELVFSIDPAAL